MGKLLLNLVAVGNGANKGVKLVVVEVVVVVVVVEVAAVVVVVVVVVVVWLPWEVGIISKEGEDTSLPLVIRAPIPRM